MKISAAIITLNAADDLDRCLGSLGFADEILVLDQGSIDATAEVCRKHNATLQQTEWLGFGPTKQKAVDLCRNDWILSIDSDEEVSPALQAALANLPTEPDCAAYTVNRLSRFLGRWIRHCGWHPDHLIRLFDRRQASFTDHQVHESIVTEGRVDRLDDLLLHYTYETMEQYVDKLNRYTTLAAEELHAGGRSASLLGAVVRAKATFLRMWLLQLGILDGFAGTVLCMASAFSVLTKYTKLWRLGRP